MTLIMGTSIYTTVKINGNIDNNIKAGRIVIVINVF